MLWDFNFCNAKKMNCTLIFIICNHYGRKCLINILQLEPCNVFKVISDMKAHCYDMWNTIIVAINFCKAKNMNFALMFIISNHYWRKYRSNLLLLEPCSDMFKVISDIIAHCIVLQCKENELYIDVRHMQSLWKKMS